MPPTEVRQCQDAESPMHGAVAVRSDSDRWGVMHPVHGGHWAVDADVADWTPMT